MKAETLVLTFTSPVPGIVPGAEKALNTYLLNEWPDEGESSIPYTLTRKPNSGKRVPSSSYSLDSIFLQYFFPRPQWLFSLSNLESACWSILLLPEISRSYFLNSSPVACMLATLANTTPRFTKHWCCSLLCLLPHSHIQLHCQMSFLCFQTYLKSVPCSLPTELLPQSRFSSSLPWPITSVPS